MENFLAYGAVGLGLALALLTFRIIQSEQKKDQPRSSIIKTTYAFMILAIILSLSGFVVESFGQKQQINILSEKLELMEIENYNMRIGIDNLKQVNTKFEKIKHALDSLCNSKGQILRGWRDMDQSEPAYIRLVKQIRTDLTNLHGLIEKELDLANK